MFNIFFNKQEEKLDEKNFINLLYTKSSNNIKIMYGICDARDLVKNLNVDISLLNRALDENHRDTLYNNLEKNNYFMGTIKLIYNNKNGFYRIIDGQHRFLAFFEFYTKTKNKDIKIDVLLEIYEVDDINGEEAKNLFKNANTCKNIDFVKDIQSIDTNQRYLELVNKLEKYFPKTIKDSSRVQYPNISTKDLKEQLIEFKILENKLDPESNRLYPGSNKDVEEVFKNIVKLNKELLKKSCEYFNLDNDNVAFQRARNNGCMLGLKKIGKKFCFIQDLL